MSTSASGGETSAAAAMYLHHIMNHPPALAENHDPDLGAAVDLGEPHQARQDTWEEVDPL